MRRHVITFAALAVAVSVVLTALTPSRMLHWDEFQLRLGMERFDLGVHHPHPPGYYLFVVLGRLLGLLDGVVEPGRMVSLLATWALIAVAMRIAHRTGTSPLVCGAVVAGWIVCSPTLVVYATSGLTYACEAVVWLAIVHLASSSSGARARWVTALIVGVAAGIRPTLGLWGLLWLGVALGRDPAMRSARALVGSAVALAAGVLVWLVPLLIEAGGGSAYLEASGAIATGNVWSKSVFVSGPGALVRVPGMLRDLVVAVGPLLGVAALVIVKRVKVPELRDLDVLLWAALLAFSFYALVIYDTDGYIVSAAVPVGVYAVVGGAALAWRTERRGWALAGPLVVFAQLWFLQGHLGTNSRLAASHRLASKLDARVQALRRVEPEGTLLVTSREYWHYGFRHVMYYLPKHHVVQLVPDPFVAEARPGAAYLYGHGRVVTMVGPAPLDPRAYADLTGNALRRLVYVVPFDVPAFVDPGCAPSMTAVPVASDEILPMLVVDERVSVRLEDGRMACSPSTSSR